MPIQAQSADGVTHEFPDETPDHVVDSVMKNYAQSQQPLSTGETTADIIKSGATGLEKAAIGAAGLQGDIASMGERVVKGGARALGLTPAPGSTYETIAHGLTKARRQFLPNSAEVQAGLEQATGTPLYKSKTGLGELAETAGEFAPAVFGGEGSLLAKAATRVALPAL